MNDDTITTKEMFELLRSDIQNQSSELKAQIAEVKTDMQSQTSELKAQIAEVKTDMQSQTSELKTQIAEVKSELKAQIAEVKTDVQSVDDRLRNVEAAVAGTTAVATYKKTLIDWLFRIAAAIGVGGAIKAFLS